MEYALAESQRAMKTSTEDEVAKDEREQPLYGPTESTQPQPVGRLIVKDEWGVRVHGYVRIPLPASVSLHGMVRQCASVITCCLRRCLIQGVA